MPSQLGQDTWILSKYSTPGYFIEIGAFHPRDLSNTEVLEQHGWRGLAVDPFPKGDWSTRPDTILVESVITGDGRDVRFIKADELGGIESHLVYHKEQVKAKPVVEIPSITPRELIERYSVPQHVHYLSVDTEGSELEILEAFPFDQLTVDAITVEHNFEEPRRTEIREYLESVGFQLDVSERWDDWYVRSGV